VPTRMIVFVAALNLLAGCGTDAGSMRTSNQLPAVSGDVVEHQPPLGDAHCRAVARQRADDARMNGYSFQIESSVRAEAYQDCLAQHAGIPK
jgi:hypothetical protein